MRRIQLVILPAILLNLLSSSFINTSKAYAGVDDFYFESMSVDYVLDKDSDSRSTLRVSEKLLPVFPDFDQNRGIIRKVPLLYDNHSLNFELKSVFRDNNPANLYKNSNENGYRELIIRDLDDNSFLYGKHEYEINYNLRDVTLAPDDAEIDEFYWDVNGSGWSQPFNKVEARVILSDAIKDNLISDRLACYTGRVNSTARNCEISYDRETNEITARTTKTLQPSETLTIAIGFRKNTFFAYQKSDQEKLADKTSTTLAYAGLLLSGLGFTMLRRLKKSSKVPKPIVTQFLPPDNSNIQLDAELVGQSTASTATLLDLAVRHKIRIMEREGLLGIKKYSFEVTNNEKLTQHDREFLKIYFIGEPINGKSYVFSKVDYLAGERARIYYAKSAKRLTAAGLYHDNKEAKRPATILLIVSIILSLGSLFIFIRLSISSLYMIDKIAFLPIAILILDAIGLTITVWPRLSEEGAKIKAHLEGLENYIKLAEVKRLEFAQSVEGAQRQIEKELDGDRTIGEKPNSRIVLYERLLPYAALFGLEKSWAKQLEIIYKSDSNYVPSWFVGSQAFNINSFSKSISLFSRSSRSSSSSSTHSGSSGGGSAGGGGGGGGGGGA